MAARRVNAAGALSRFLVHSFVRSDSIGGDDGKTINLTPLAEIMTSRPAQQQQQQHYKTHLSPPHHLADSSLLRPTSSLFHQNVSLYSYIVANNSVTILGKSA